MARIKPKAVLYRRKRESRTNYRKRLRLLASRELRLVVRFTNQRVIAQLIRFTPIGDGAILGVDSFALKKLGWPYSCKNIPAAYLTGLFLGRRALKTNIKKAVLDLGFRSSHHKGKVNAFLKGVLDSGLQVPHGDEKIFPDREQLSGKHIEQYADHLRNQQELYERQFGQYLKNKAQPEKISKAFEQTVQKIKEKFEEVS